MSVYRPKIFVGTLAAPESDMSAGDTRFLGMLEMLTEKYDIDLFVDWPIHAREEKARRELAAIGVRLLPYRFFGCGDLASAALSKQGYDLALFESYKSAENSAAIFRRYNPRSPIILDTVDLHFARAEAGVAFGFGSAEAVNQAKQRELSVYRYVDALILASSLDKDVLKQEEKMPTLQEVIPIILPTRPRTERPRRNTALFVGGFGHEPNRDAIRWFVEEIWDEVRKAVPDAALQIIGSEAGEEIQRLGEHSGVEFLGRVPSTLPYLDDAAVSIAPLRFGAGMKGKVCEAMASGLPVVTTTVGAQGLGAVSEQHFLLADTCTGFAEAVIRLLRHPDEAEKIGRAGQKHIAELCSPQAAKQKLLTLAETLTETPVHQPPGPVWWARHGAVLASNIVQRGTDRVRQVFRHAPSA